MAVRVLSRRELPIVCEDDVVLVRREVRTRAQERGFDPGKAGVYLAVGSLAGAFSNVVGARTPASSS